jgi:hypothetical protein
MIIIYLSGGIGNQLFQYSMGKSLSERYNCELLFDIRSFNWDTLRNFELNKLGLNYKIADLHEIEVVKKYPLTKVEKIKQKIGFKIPYYKKSFIKEYNFNYDPNFELYRNKYVYLEGYWQSEKYFKNIRSIILKDLKFENLSKKAREYKNQILKINESVSIHVRRGDYAKNPETTEYHGLMDVEYYLNSIKILKNRLCDPVFYIFSDDKEYVKMIFENIPNINFVENLENDIEDLHLMSICKHQIIANSSFSWWGAWLNDNKSKIVVAPKKWFKNEEIQSQTRDLIPEEWLRI